MSLLHRRRLIRERAIEAGAVGITPPHGKRGKVPKPRVPPRTSAKRSAAKRRKGRGR